jgi:CheY-like chemotaxis protein
VSVPPAALLARLRAHVGEASERAIPLTEWVDGLRREVSPQLDAARKLRGLAAQRPACVLVVDDDRFQCKLLERLLADFDCRLQFAHSGAEAFAALARERPELILMDVQLPDADGVAITRQLKANPALAGIPVIMITGHSERNILQASLAAGAVDFVVKPFERERMHAKLAKFLHGRGRG